MVANSAALDKLAIMERLHRYGWGYDAKDLDMLRDTFTAGAALSMYLDGAEWGPYVGREAIVEWMIGYMRSQSDQRRHSMTNVLFDEISETAASVRAFAIITAAEHGIARLVTTGWYRIRMIKEEQAWRIAKLELLLDAPF